MNRSDQEGKNMLMLVKSIYDGNSTYATLRPKLVPIMAALTTQLQNIIQAQTRQATVTVGDTHVKEQKFDTLCLKLWKIASAAFSYSTTPPVNDLTLKAKVNFTLAKIQAVNYDDIEEFAQNIIDAVTPVIADLEDFGVVLADLTAASDAKQKFHDVHTLPQQDISNRKTQTNSIHPFVKEGKRILTENADGIINTLFETQPAMFNAWFNARPIVHLPHGTTVAEGFVFESDGITPIYNAEIKFSPQNIVLTSFLDGSFQKPQFPHGVTTVTATVPGRAPVSLPPQEIKQGKRVHFIFKMPPL